MFYRKVFNTYIVDIDQHYVFFLFGVRLFSIKHRHKNVFPKIKSLGVTEQKRKTKIVVSMTSYPARIKSAILALKTLLNQTVKPDIVVLWLAEEQFPNRKLPADLIELEQYGLTICWCEDIRSYKKLIPSLRRFPDDIIITVDDDICYSHDTVEALYNSYLKHPHDVHANRCGRVKIDNGHLKNIPTCYLYDKNFSDASYLNRLTGHAGVLYPPHAFSPAVFHGFMNILPTHDDVWFWGMLVLNGVKTRIVKGFSESVYPIEHTQEMGLCRINHNDSTTGISINEAYARIVEKFPDILTQTMRKNII